MAEYCRICGGEMDVEGDETTRNCGGDCLMCMATVGEDPDCIAKLKYIEENDDE